MISGEEKFYLILIVIAFVFTRIAVNYNTCEDTLWILPTTAAKISCSHARHTMSVETVDGQREVRCTCSAEEKP